MVNIQHRRKNAKKSQADGEIGEESPPIAPKEVQTGGVPPEEGPEVSPENGS